MIYKTYAPYAFAAAVVLFASSGSTRLRCSTMPILPEIGDYRKETCNWDSDGDNFPEHQEVTFFWNGRPTQSESRYFQWNSGTSSRTRKTYFSSGKLQRLEFDFNDDSNPDEVIVFSALEGKVAQQHFMKNSEGKLVAISE